MAIRRIGPSKLRNKTRNGKNKRLKIVKLDTSGLTKFMNTLGPNGQTFRVGLFDKENARKGLLLEEGDETHKKLTKRPWLSQMMAPGTPQTRDITQYLADFVKKALKGQNVKKLTANQIQKRIQDGLYLQEFQAAKLSPYTVDKKAERGAVNPDGIGLDSLKMLKAIKVRTSGGKRTSKNSASGKSSSPRPSGGFTGRTKL